MHFSAERGLAIACRLSVCPSVRLSVCDVGLSQICDHIGWKSWKLTAQSISPTPSLIAAKRRSTYSHGNMGKFWGDYRWGREKVACCRIKAAISRKRVKIEEKLPWTAYRNSPTFFRTAPSPTPCGLPFLEIGGLQLSYPLLSQERVKLRTSNFVRTFIGSIRTKAHEKCWE